MMGVMTRGALISTMRCALIVLVLAGAPALAQDGAQSQTSIYTSGASSTQALAVKNVDIGPDGSVRGTLSSQSADVIRDVKLAIDHVWHWNDEQNPGEDSPGRSTYFHVGSDVPPMGTLDFSYTPSPPLLERSDGVFSTKVGIVSYTEVSFRKELRPVER